MNNQKSPNAAAQKAPAFRLDQGAVMSFVQKYTMILVLVLVTAFFYWQTGGQILSPNNLTNLFSQNAYVFVLATGMLLCILTGGNIDLSVGSVVCFCSAVGVVLMRDGLSPWLGAAVILVIGLAIGAWQAFWIAYVKVPPFITTLAGMLVFRGLSNVILQGKTVSIKGNPFIKVFGGGADCFVPDFFRSEKLPTAFTDLMTKLFGDLNVFCLFVALIVIAVFVVVSIMSRMNRVKKGYEVEHIAAAIVKTAAIAILVGFFAYKLSQRKGLPYALIWVALIVGTYSYITSKTTVGRHFYAVGGNEQATKLSGINTKLIYFIAYTNMGLLAAFAGMLASARVNGAMPDLGKNFEMDAIGSCFIGGASAYGGIGTVPGVIIGALLMGIINQGMSIMSIDQNYQQVVKGLVLLGAVIFDVVSKKKQR